MELGGASFTGEEAGDEVGITKADAPINCDFFLVSDKVGWVETRSERAKAQATQGEKAVCCTKLRARRKLSELYTSFQ